MKKSIFSFFMAAAALVGFSACSSDEPMTGAADGNVSFTLELPAQIQSRAFSDGTTATELTYTVYDEDNGSTVVKTDKAIFTNLKTTVSLSLVTGKSYSIVFWAQKPGNSYYTYDAVGKTITVDYSGDAQDEGRDAFFAARGTFHVTGPMSETITLKRPFAQINVGTTDWQAAVDSKIDVTATGMKVKGVYNSFNLATGELAGNPVDVTFNNAAMPGAGESLTGEGLPAGLKYLAMNYVLVGEKTTVDVTLTTNSATKPDMEFTQVPVQRNFRTNIYGALLTNPVDFNVNIDQNFEKPDYKYEVVAKTAGDFVAAIVKPGDTKIIVESSLNLTEIPLESIAFHDNKTIEMTTPEAELVVNPATPLTSYKSLTINGGKITNMDTKGARTGENVGAKQLIVARAGKLELNGVTMVCDTTYHWHGTADNTSAITYWDLESVTIKDCTVKSGMFALCGMGRNNNHSKILIENSTFESNSSSAFNGTNWAYCIRLFGDTGEMNNCTVKGVQGGLSPDSGIHLTINGGKYITVNTPGKVDAFYAVYATNNAVVTINGGEFIAANNRFGSLIEGTSAIVSGNNDTNLPDGNFIINYGKFSGKAYDSVTNKIIKPAGGKVYTEISEGELKWEVKK